MKLLLILIPLFIVGCASQPKPMAIPMPAPMPSCDYKIGGKCKTSSASDISGNTTLGHHSNEDISEK